MRTGAVFTELLMKSNKLQKWHHVSKMQPHKLQKGRGEPHRQHDILKQFAKWFQGGTRKSYIRFIQFLTFNIYDNDTLRI